MAATGRGIDARLCLLLDDGDASDVSLIVGDGSASAAAAADDELER